MIGADRLADDLGFALYIENVISNLKSETNVTRKLMHRLLRGAIGIFDKAAGRLVAPTMDGVNCEHGLAEGRHLIPWSKWSAGDIRVKTEICQVKQEYSDQEIFVVGARVTLNNTRNETSDIGLYVVLRPIGPAGFDVKELVVGRDSDALLV